MGTHRGGVPASLILLDNGVPLNEERKTVVKKVVKKVKNVKVNVSNKAACVILVVQPNASTTTTTANIDYPLQRQ